MADIQNLINTINKKFTNNDDTASKIYRDEPILKTAAQMANFTPQKYREMRKLVKSGPVFYASDTAQIFYEQGKFMEDHTDEYQYNGEYQSYYPTYQYMTDQQLRGYFSWRAKVRDGIIDKTSLSFVFVYIYELLMQIGVRSAEEGFYKIKDFWQTYKDIDPKINHYIKRWLKDYVIYYGLEKHLLDDFADTNLDHAVLTLINCHSHSVDKVFSALNSFSSYNLENSRFYKMHADDVKHVVYNVFTELTEYYNKNRKNSICERFFGKIVIDSYVMFHSAVFYSKEIHKDCVYEINDVCKYRCRNGRWTYERFIFLKDKNKYIGELLKTIDFTMRQEYDLKSTLKVDKVKKVYQDIIVKVTRGLLEDKKKKAVPEINIDISKLQNIRKTALVIQNKLIVEDSEEVTKEAAQNKVVAQVDATAQVKADDQVVPVAQPAATEVDQADTAAQTVATEVDPVDPVAHWKVAEVDPVDPVAHWKVAEIDPVDPAAHWKVAEIDQLDPAAHWKATAAAPVAPAAQAEAANLSTIEYEFMKCLLYGKDYSDLVKSNGLMLSVLTDSINEKLYDMFCDTVLIFEGDKPELIEDYEAELKEIIL